MLIDKIKLTNFRNHKKLEIQVDGKSLLFIGPNGIGKTNILEALHLISTTKSLRARYDREIINHEEDFARVEVQIEEEEETTNLELFIQKSETYANASKKAVKIDKTAKSINAFAGTLNTVIFIPESMDLISGSPSNRRKYLDSVIYQIDKEYKKASSKYVKIVRQRNKILEMINETNSGHSLLEYWDKELLEQGNLIQDRREDFLNFVESNINKHAIELTEEKNTFSIKYIKKGISKAKIAEYRPREIAAKNTLMGPHRDEVEFYMDGFDVGKFASRGQQRTNILALKLCELDYMEEKIGKRPILLLDDIYSELDGKHKQAIDNVIPLQQTFITSAETQNSELQIEEIN